MSDVQASLEQYRGIREALEKAVLPLATSVDGRRFRFQTTLHGIEFEAGGYVRLDDGGPTRLGQVLSLELDTEDAPGPGLPQVRIRVASGDGVVLDGDGRPFHDAFVQAARPDEVGAWLDRIRPERALLDVGELALARGIQFGLDAGGFGRHTFLCGQSGSGKTYALGVLLERLLMETREPVAIVIDEAHNICPAEPADLITALATEDAIRIAGEGRKFGLYLIVVTQRPQKVHENVVSQCDNLVLMRMSSMADLAYVASIFSFVPPGLIDRATTFCQGEALVAGKIASHPALIRFGARITHEGGADVAGW